MTTLQSPISPEPASPQIPRGCVRLHKVWKFFTAKSGNSKASQMTDAILVAASVIAAMNYQAVLSPPRGVYQETKYKYNSGHLAKAYQAGEAIGAYLNPDAYKNFYMFNTISFTSSMSILVLLLCGVSLERRIFSFLTTYTMYVAITATTYSYAVALDSITPDSVRSYVQKITTPAFVGCMVVASVTFLASHRVSAP